MRSITSDTVTQAVIDSFAATGDERLKFVLGRLVSHLHAFARETRPSHDEWRRAMGFLHRAGQISSSRRNEFILLSDILGLSSLVDLLDGGDGATESSLLGPFHIEGAPLVEVGADLIGDNPGEPVVLSGRVLDVAGRPLAGALLDVWHTGANGLYSNQDPDQSEFNFRFRMRTDGEGRYAFSTICPGAYTAPSDGPGGELLRATGRHAWRTSHFHVVVGADGHRPLITELFPAHDPYVDQDCVFSVRESLLIHFRPESDRAALPAALAARDRLTLPVQTAAYDFVLAVEGAPAS